MGGGKRRNGAGGFACPCHWLSQQAPLHHMRQSPGCKTSPHPSPSVLDQGLGPFSSTDLWLDLEARWRHGLHRAFVFHPNVLKTYCNLILLGQSLANWFLHAGFPWELLRDTIYCKKFFQWQQQEPCFTIATLNPTPGQGMLMNFPRPCAWLSKIMLLSAPLPDFSELVKDLGYLLKDSCELSFMEYIIFHRCLLWSDPRHAPDLGSSWDNTNHKRQLVSQRH